MGCFSYLCSVCNKPINSTSFDGEGVKLFLIQGGKVLEEMQGNYNSYGSVLDLPRKKNQISSGDDWTNDWGDIVDLCFNNDAEDGIIAIHTDCWKEGMATPNEHSEQDPDQGWGKLKRGKAKETFHKFYSKIK